MLAPWLGRVTPFTVTRPSQFRAEPPPALTSHKYARDYREIKAIGALNSSSRTPAQTDLAHFWNLNYVVVLNRLLRDVADAHVEEIGRSARLFALASMATADAAITSWDTKNRFVSWRPIHAIRLGDTDGNPLTVADPTWEPLIATPPYPDHNSGANILVAATTRSLALFFGTDRMSFTLTTTNTGLTVEDTRAYERFSDVQREVVKARIYEGIHFRFADESGREQGVRVADWAFSNVLRPLRDHRHGDDDHDDHDRLK
jgi:hypothetical protein